MYMYANGDKMLASCVELGDDTWNRRFLEGLSVKNDLESEESDTKETDPLPPPPKI